MNYRRFGTTDLKVSELGFGCARLGGVFGASTKDDMLRMLRSAHEQGITFFDTADMYCQGESEALLGQAFRANRQQVVIATKAGYCLPGQRRLASRLKPLLRPLVRQLGLKREQLPSGVRGTLTQDFSPDYLLKAVESSLRRLRTDYVDLFQLHSPPAAALADGAFLEPLEKLKTQGKIRNYGVSCETVEDGRLCLRYPSISGLQIRLSLLDQRPLDGLVQQGVEQRIGLIARECFGGGLLAKAEAPPNDGMLAESDEQTTVRRRVAGYKRLAESQGRSLPELALQFVLKQEPITVTLLGMRTDDHLTANMRYFAAAPLAQEELQALRG
jgi:aryl-alcohol dehydrogenase-like predicted oxidoreductase